MKKDKKLIFSVLAQIAFLIVALCYWSNNNAKNYCSDTTKNILGLVEVSNTQKYSAKPVEIFVRANEELKHKYVITELKPEADRFFAAWKKTDTLDKATVSVYSKNIKEIGVRLDIRYHSLSIDQFWATVVILLIVSTFLWLITYTNILRDPVSIAAQIYTEKVAAALQSKETNNIVAPYSLSRSQLACWITIVSSVYIFAVLWDEHVVMINSTALILMGISVSTYAAGAILDITEIQGGVPRHQETRQSSGNFFKDILSDEYGISLHRFQMFVWTIIAIIVYFYNYQNPAPTNTSGLPELDMTLLALSGISGAAYLTLKTRENPGSGKVIESFLITLEPADGLTDAEKLAINNSAEGLRKAEITLSTGTAGEETHAAPESPEAKFKFVAKQLKVGKYYKISVEWKGKIKDIETTLTGSSDITIDEAKPNITIKVNKKA